MSDGKCSLSDHQGCSHTPTGYEQTLAEMEFEHSIFNACVQGDLNRVKSLINKNGKIIVNSQEKQSGYSALHYAARNNHHEICRYLLQCGADPNLVTSSCKSSALHRAAYMCHLDVVKLLIEHRADALLVDCDGKTALHKCVENKRKQSWIQVAQLLVKTDSKLLKVADLQNMTPGDYCSDLESLIA